MELTEGKNSVLKMKGSELCGLPDCVYLSEKGACVYLKERECEGFSCRFLKTKKDGARNESRWAERICSLPEKEQIKIAKKYYNGKMPWKERGKSHV